jgi:hypothetical protein
VELNLLLPAANHSPVYINVYKKQLITMVIGSVEAGTAPLITV